MVFNPTGELNIDACPDSGFGGMYGYELPNDPSCTKSRTGCLVNLSRFPVTLVSRLQRETVLSTMEADVNAMSQCCRDLFPIMDMVSEIGQVVGLPTNDKTKMHVSVREDNTGALILAQTLPLKLTPRSKCYAIKTVWFREESNKRGVKLLKIESAEQLGDIFTKGLSRLQFEYLRKEVMGW